MLHGLLPNEHYTHFIFLSEAIFILLGEGITTYELEHSEQLLQHFCLMFSPLYTKGKETINVHSLLHLADDDGNLGPLWTHSCFPFESYNGNLLKLFHRTQNVELQIVSAVAITQSLPSLKLKLIPGSIEEEFFNSLTNPFYISKENIAALGSPVVKTLNREQLIALGQYLGFAPLLDRIPCFKRVRICGSVFHSLSYKRVTARNSCTVLFQDSSPYFNDLLIGQVGFYVQYQLPCTNSLSCMENCVCHVETLALVHAFPEVPGFTSIEGSLTHATGIQITAINSRAPRALGLYPYLLLKRNLFTCNLRGKRMLLFLVFPIEWNPIKLVVKDRV